MTSASTGIEAVRREVEELRGEPTQALAPDEIPCREISSAAQLCAEPLVSVAMLAYNHAPFLRAAIEGVLQQQAAFPFELVIGEDGSSDDTRAIALEFQQRHPQVIRVLVSDANVGMARNGLRVEARLRGRYVAYCEGDDCWTDPAKLALQVAALERDPEVGLAYCAGRTRTEDGRVEDLDSSFWQERRDGSLFRMLLRHGCGFVPTCGVLVRAAPLRRGFEQNPLFRLDLSLGDLVRWLEVLRDSRGLLLPRPMVLYVRHPDSATRTDSRRLLRDVAVVRYWQACQSADAADLQRPLLRNLVVCRAHWALAQRGGPATRVRRLASALTFGRRRGVRLTPAEWLRLLADGAGLVAAVQEWRAWRQRRAGHRSQTGSTAA